MTSNMHCSAHKGSVAIVFGEVSTYYDSVDVEDKASRTHISSQRCSGDAM